MIYAFLLDNLILVHDGIAADCTDRCPVADLGGYRQAALVDGDFVLVLFAAFKCNTTRIGDAVVEYSAGRECYFDEFGILRYGLRHDDGGGIGGSGGEIV